MPPSAEKVQQTLRQLGYSCEVVEMPDSTRTAKEAAQAIGCATPQIAKSLVFRAKQSGAPVLVIASGSNRVNEKSVSQYLGEPIERADPEYVREQTGFAIGGVPPVGHLKPIRTIVDRDLFQYDVIWAAAGTPNAVFRLTAAELEAMTGGVVMPIA
jgi:prolyl-tRNA editing enzyme YbaK/EbsC (Cys-tRNA(Pro) deacylase)